MFWIFPDWLCFYIGLFTVLLTVFKLVLRFVKRPYDLVQRYGKGWAVVTGGSDGIGLGFCQQLAKLGFNICVISRNKQKIDRVCQSLKKINSSIETKTVVADFSRSLQSGFFEKIMKQLESLDICILVNNVGVLTDIGNYVQNSPQQIHKICTVNLIPCTMMTRHLLPKMLARQKKGGIIILSSSSILFRLKHSVNYCSSKVFDDILSRSLEYELGDKIDFLSLQPGLVTTQMARNTTSLIHVSKNQCAKGALKSLGCYSYHAGAWFQDLQNFLIMLIPQSVRDFLTGRIWAKMGQLYDSIDKKKKQKTN